MTILDAICVTVELYCFIQVFPILKSTLNETDMVDRASFTNPHSKCNTIESIERNYFTAAGLHCIKSS